MRIYRNIGNSIRLVAVMMMVMAGIQTAEAQ